MKQLGRAPNRPEAAETHRAHKILCYAFDTTASLLTAFGSVRAIRKAKGASTDEEQDLLRAMVVFACSGLDSMSKHLVADCLPMLVERSVPAQLALEKYALRRLLRGEAAEAAGIDAAFLAQVLARGPDRAALAKVLVDDLTSSSLQSHEEILKVVHHLGLDPIELGIEPQALRLIFKARNRIIHEMDIDFDHPSRNRTTHRRDDVVQRVNTVLELASALLTETHRALTNGGSSKTTTPGKAPSSLPPTSIRERAKPSRQGLPPKKAALEEPAGHPIATPRPEGLPRSKPRPASSRRQP